MSIRGRVPVVLSQGEAAAAARWLLVRYRPRETIIGGGARFAREQLRMARNLARRLEKAARRKRPAIALRIPIPREEAAWYAQQLFFGRAVVISALPGGAAFWAAVHRRAGRPAGKAPRPTVGKRRQRQIRRKERDAASAVEASVIGNPAVAARPGRRLVQFRK